MKHWILFLLSSLFIINFLHGMIKVDKDFYRIHSKWLKRPCLIFSEIDFDALESKPQAHSYKVERVVHDLSLNKTYYDISFYDEDNKFLGAIYYSSKNIAVIENLPKLPFDLSHIPRKKRCVIQ